MTMPPTVRVAIAQAEVSPTLALGLERTAELTQDAAAKGAALVVFPETWLPGYPSWLDRCRDAALWDHAPAKAVFGRLASESVDVHGSSGAALAQLAADCSVTLVVGVSERVTGGPGHGTLYNSLLVYGPEGELLNHHRKLIPTYTERLVWGPGDAVGLQAVATPVGRLGGLVCWEHWMPLARQSLHQSGEDIHVAVWPTVHDNHQLASRHYALEGRCYVLAAGALLRTSALPQDLELAPTPLGASAEWALRGGSAIIGPTGAYLVPPQFDRPHLLLADLDLARNREEHMTLDVAGHYHRPDCFEFATVRRPRSNAG